MSANPKWSISRTIQAGHQALELAGRHADVLTPRLPAGLTDGLGADLATAEGTVSSAILAPKVLKSLTATQNAATTNGHALVIAARDAIVRAGTTKAQQTAFGVGAKLTKNMVSHVLAGLTAVIDGTTRYPDLAREAGLLETDIEAARHMRDAVSSANAAQERGKQVRKLTTAARNAVLVRIENAVERIASVGALAFYTRPEIAEQFKKIVPRTTSRRSTGNTPVEPPIA